MFLPRTHFLTLSLSNRTSRWCGGMTNSPAATAKPEMSREALAAATQRPHKQSNLPEEITVTKVSKRIIISHPQAPQHPAHPHHHHHHHLLLHLLFPSSLPPPSGASGAGLQGAGGEEPGPPGAGRQPRRHRLAGAHAGQDLSAAAGAAAPRRGPLHPAPAAPPGHPVRGLRGQREGGGGQRE